LQEGPGNLLGGQVADLSQGERHLGIGRQGRVAAGEDQAQAVVSEQFVLTGVLPLALEEHDQVRLRAVETRPSTHCIDGLEATGGDQPRPGVVRHTITLPTLDGNEERIVHGLLSQVEIPQQANQRRQDAP